MIEPEKANQPKSARLAVGLVYALTVPGILAWLAAIFLAPYLRSRGAGALSALLYAVFAPLCHQIPDRCLVFHGCPLAVCARCLGIYAGFLAGLAGYPFVRGWGSLALPKARLVVLSSLPMGLDFLAGAAGLWASPPGLRIATGLVWGLALPYYFVPGAAELVLRVRSRRAARHVLPMGGIKR